jgi:hypothetical protein
MIPYNAYTLRKAIKRLEIESGNVETLKLFGGIGHERAWMVEGVEN